MSQATEHAAGESNKTFTIVVNATERTVTSKVITFDEVVNLAYPGGASDPNRSFSVTFRKSEESKHDGTMVEGDTIKIKDGTVFNVTPTTKS